MGKKRWTKNPKVQTIGSVALILLCVSFWAIVIKAENFIRLVLGLGLLLAAGIAVGLIIRVLPAKFKRMAAIVAFCALFGWFIGMIVTVAQRWIFRLPNQFTDELVLSNTIVATIFILWNRWEKRSEEDPE